MMFHVLIYSLHSNKLHLTSPASLPIHLYHKQAPIGGAVTAVAVAAVAVTVTVTAVAVAAVAVAGIRAMDVVAATLMLISTNLLTLTLKIIPTMDWLPRRATGLAPLLARTMSSWAPIIGVDPSVRPLLPRTMSTWPTPRPGSRRSSRRCRRSSRRRCIRRNMEIPLLLARTMDLWPSSKYWS